MMKKNILFLIAIICSLPILAQFESASFMINGNTLPYQVLFPKDYDETKQYPLVVFLHGAGERGNDNQKQLVHGKQFFIDNFYVENPSIVIAPQCPEGNYWASVIRHQIGDSMTFTYGTYEPTIPMQVLQVLIREWISSGKVDKSQVYIGGLSMGGMGTLEILWRMPDTFAAAFAICGGADLKKMSEVSKHTPVWLFHGDADSIVPVENSRNIYKTFQKSGGDVEYSEYKGVDHNSWDNAFLEKKLVPWLFEHKKR